MRAALVLLVAGAALLAQAKPLEPCPSTCRCYLAEGLKRADCKHIPEWADQQSDAQDVRILPPPAGRGSRSSALHLTHFEVFPKVLQLEVTNRSIVEIIPSGFHGLQSLQELNLSHNLLSRFNYKVFLRMPALRRLVLQGNPIVLEPGVPLLSSKSLLSLDLSHCDIVDVPRGSLDRLRNLTSLSLRGNMLHLEAGRPLLSIKTLTELDLSACELEAVPAGTLDGLVNLRRLYLDGNNLHVVEKGVLPRGLHHLDLSANLIRDAPTAVISSLRSLTKLELSDNPVTCTCSLIGLQGWLSRHLVVTEKPVLCAEPAKYRGLSWTKVNELELCQAEAQAEGQDDSSATSDSSDESSEDSDDTATDETDETSVSIEMPPDSYEMYTHENNIKYQRPVTARLDIKPLNLRSQINAIQGDQPYDLHSGADYTTPPSRESMENQDESDEEGRASVENTEVPFEENEATEKDAVVFMRNADTIAMGKSMPEGSHAEEHGGDMAAPATAAPEEDDADAPTAVPDHKEAENEADGMNTEPSAKHEGHAELPVEVPVASEDVTAEPHQEEKAEHTTAVPVTEKPEGDRSDHSRALGAASLPEEEHPDQEHPGEELSGHSEEDHSGGEHSAGENASEGHPEEEHGVPEEHPDDKHLLVGLVDATTVVPTALPEAGEADGGSDVAVGGAVAGHEGGNEEGLQEGHKEDHQDGQHGDGEPEATTPVAHIPVPVEEEEIHPEVATNIVGSGSKDGEQPEVEPPVPVVIPEHESEHEMVHEPEQKPEHELEHEAEHVPEHELEHEAKHVPEHEAVHETEHEPEHKSETEHEPESPIPAPEAVPESAPETPLIIPEVEPEAVPESKPEKEPESKPEVEPEAPDVVPVPATEVPVKPPVETVSVGSEPDADVAILAGAVPGNKPNEELAVAQVPANPEEQNDEELQKSTITYIILGCIVFAMVVLVMYALLRSKAKKTDKPVRREAPGTEMKDMMNPLLEAAPEPRRGSLVSLELIREVEEDSLATDSLIPEPATDADGPQLDTKPAADAKGARGANGTAPTQDKKVNEKDKPAKATPNGKPVAPKAPAPASAPTPAPPPAAAPAPASTPTQQVTQPSKVKVKAGVISTPVPRTPVLVNRANGTNGVNGSASKVNGLNRSA